MTFCTPIYFNQKSRLSVFLEIRILSVFDHQSGGRSSSTFWLQSHHVCPSRSMRSSVTHHHELASTTRSWEQQTRRAATSSRCWPAPVRLLRAGLSSMVRRVTASRPLSGKVLCCRDMWRKRKINPRSVLLWDANRATATESRVRVPLTCVQTF